MNYRNLFLLTLITMTTSFSSYSMEPEAASDELPQESPEPIRRTRRGEHGVYISPQDQPQQGQPIPEQE